jgi:5-methylcytosine-specific restriction protein B
MFSWKKIYAEIVARLPEYREQTRKLADLMTSLHAKGLKVSGIQDEYPKGRKTRLTETDPFTFLAIFNRGVTVENRIAILREIKGEWQLKADLPADFDGIPLVNTQNSWFMPYRYKRKPEHIGKLWQFFIHVAELEHADELDCPLFDECCALSHVAPAGLTMAMFWTRPDVWIAVDRKNVNKAKRLNVGLPIKSGDDYLNWLRQVRLASDLSPAEFSYQAEIESTDSVEESQTEIDRNYWLMAPGEKASLWNDWFENKTAAIGWGDLEDLQAYDSPEAIAEYLPEYYPDSGPKRVGRMLWEFSHEMKPGDVVFAKRGLHKVCGWGVVQGNYFYDENGDPFQHTLPVDWRPSHDVTMPTDLQLPLQTLTKMSGKTKFLRAMKDAFPDAVAASATESDKDPSPVPPVVPKPGYSLADASQQLFIPNERVELAIELLRHKKNLILQGAPGTGKTFVARRLAYLLMECQDDSRVQMVQFHQSTSYEDFIQGFKPDGRGSFTLRNGTFHRFCTVAMHSPKLPFVFIIDEINRGNLSKVLGEMLMLIEHDKREPQYAIPLTYSQDSDQTFYVPPNVHLIGTMNTADRSLSMVDYALRRRFSFIDLEPGFATPSFASYLKAAGATNQLIDLLRSRMSLLNDLIGSQHSALGRGFCIGHSYFTPASGITVNSAWLERVYRYEVLPLLEEYFFDDPVGLKKARGIFEGQPS